MCGTNGSICTQYPLILERIDAVGRLKLLSLVLNGKISQVYLASKTQICVLKNKFRGWL